MKKSSLSDREYVALEPNEADIATKDGGKYLPIEVVERDLDRWAWSTEKFTWQQYRDNRGNSCVSATLELVIPWTNDDGSITERRLTGGCNFIIVSYLPNDHFVATAKSECVKNAASDLGKKFGRGLNADAVPERTAAAPEGKPRLKMQPDDKIKKEYLRAVAADDRSTIATLCEIYEFKTPNNGNETL